MKTNLRNQSRQQGTVLLVSLFLAVLLGTLLFYYLNGVQTQKALVVRSQNWNSALTLAEAGVEEALAQLNPGAPAPVIDRTANGWGAAANGVYGPVARTVSSGSYAVVYTTDTLPIIYSTGYVSIPPLTGTVQRVVRVATTNAPLFSVGVGAKNGIDLKGNSVATDSFNSALANLSNNGLYDATKTSTNGDIASIAGIVNVGNANVKGSVLLGPTATDTIQKNGYVLGGVAQDFNVEFEDVIVPGISWLPAMTLASPLVVGGNSFTYAFLLSGDYSINNLNSSIYVGSNAVVRLKLTGNASPDNILVAGSGSSAGKLTIYMDGQTFTVGNSVSVEGGNSANLAYYGTTNNTGVKFTGNASFTGTIYAPEAAVTLGGGGNNTYDVVGSIIANTVTMNGHFNFHFDENLIAAGPSRGYVAASWREL